MRGRRSTEGDGGTLQERGPEANVPRGHGARSIEEREKRRGEEEEGTQKKL